MMGETNGTYGTGAIAAGIHAESAPQTNSEAFEAQQSLHNTTTAPSAAMPHILVGGGNL
jgi:hypothetical protein